MICRGVATLLGLVVRPLGQVGRVVGRLANDSVLMYTLI